jgi:hypothetical protein
MSKYNNDEGRGNGFATVVIDGSEIIMMVSM